jgi:uncharacterized protein (TIGR02266 family)
MTEKPRLAPEEHDRRKSPRTAVVIPVDYSTVDDFFSEFTTNINEGGMFVGTDQPHPIDTVVTLHFRLPGGDDPCAVTGRVVWVRERANDEGPRGMGIEFEELDDLTRLRINDLVRELRTQA